MLLVKQEFTNNLIFIFYIWYLQFIYLSPLVFYLFPHPCYQFIPSLLNQDAPGKQSLCAGERNKKVSRSDHKKKLSTRTHEGDAFTKVKGTNLQPELQPESAAFHVITYAVTITD